MNRDSLQRFGLVVLFAAVAVALGPTAANAHTGVGPTHDVLHGLEHPLTGIDHICAMIAVGLWAAQRGGRSLWLVPLTFVPVLAAGGALGMSGVQILFAEQGIVLSVIVLGIFIAAGARLMLPISAVIIGLFALVHGYAHGTEIPTSASGVAYSFGFAFATTILLVIGISFGWLIQRTHSSQLIRIAGFAIAACGIYLGIR